MAEVHSVMIPLNNMRLLVAATHDNLSGLRDQISWFCKQFEVMLGFLLMHYSEKGNSRCDHMGWFVGIVKGFAAEYGDVIVDAFEIMCAEKHATGTTNSTREDHGDDESPAAVIGPEARKVIRFIKIMYAAAQLTTSTTNSTREDHAPAGAISPDTRELIKAIVSFIETCNSDEYYRTVCKKAAEESMQIKPLQRRHWVMDGTDILGFEFYRCMMERRLLEERGTEQLNVIAITGEGGTGKTTLAKILYRGFKNYTDIECCGWISVSKAYVFRDLLLSILDDIMIIAEEIYEMEEWELKQQLRKQLSGRRYLIVIDDIWDTQAWDELKDLFPTNRNYSRILITTRFPIVASYATRPGRNSFPLPDDIFFFETIDTNMMWQYYNSCFAFIFGHSNLRFGLKGIWQCDCFELKPLVEHGSWLLFSSLYFGEPCPFDGEDTPGMRIVRSCCGRLLVLSVVARILRAIDRVDDCSSWSSIAGRINKKFSWDYNPQMDILTLCFNKLPQHLQSCFLYLGVFPEDTEISAKQLIQLWIAEGLTGLPEPLENNANCTMEDVGKCYLEELIGLGLIQVSTSRSDGGAKSCYIHDILRDFCIHLSKERKFLEVHTGGDHVSTNADQTKPKKLSILDNCREYLSKSKNSSGSCSPVRSFSSFSQDTQSFSKEDWKSLFKHFRLLRVLNLGKQEAQNKLDDSIGDLFHLRYLKVRPAKNITLPISAIFNLWNLQTIDLRKTSFPKLPEGLWKMQQLRHLYLGGRSRLPKAENEDHLPNLVTLSYVSNDPRGATRIAEKAPNLRKLGLHGYCCASQEEQKATFNLQHLQSLKFAQECTFKEAITLPATITKLTVKGALLQPNAIKMFGELPNLQTLKLVRTNFENDELKVLGKDPFPRLELLKLVNSAIVSWKLEKGAMLMLRHLVISCCFQLPELPTEICKDSALLKLELCWPSKELANKLAEELEVKKKFELLIYPPLSDFSKLLLSAGKRYRDLLDINPTELKFPFKLHKQTSCSMQLANNTNEFVAFEVQEIHPMKFRIYPSTGIILPGSTCNVSVTMIAQKKAPSKLETNGLLVSSVVVPSRAIRRGVTSDMFNKEAGKVVEKFELRIVYVPADPPSLVHEESSPWASMLEKVCLGFLSMFKISEREPSFGKLFRDGDFLDINPTELKFPFELYKQSSCSMQLVNNTYQFVAFKVQVTKPNNYRLSPPSGIVLPGSTFDVVVIMRAPVKALSNMKSEDNFLVQSVVAPYGATRKDIASDMFNKEAGKVVKELKLSVIYVPTNPLSPTTSVLEKEKLLSSGTRDRDHLLDINPTKLKFPFELYKQSSCPMQLTNNTNQFVAFKVQATNTNNYCVSSSSGIVLPGSTFDVVVIMRAPVKALSNMKSKDSFLVQSVVAPQGATHKDITSDMFDKEAGKVVEKFKLSVIYVPTNPLSPTASVLEKEKLLSDGTRDRDHLLDINPTELKFPYELYRQSSCPMQLANNTNQFVAFRVQVTNPNNYCVSPPSGIVLPGSTLDVVVTMQAPVKALFNMKSKDKFLVKSVVTPCKDITSDIFDEEAGKVVEKFKLSVIYVPTNPLSPMASVLEKEKLLSDGTRDSDHLLDIHPTELKFPFELYKQSSCPMQLANNTNQFVAFKVQVTNPNNYCVSPPSGIVLPGSTFDVVVTMRAPVKALSNMKSKDSFLVQSVVTPCKDITSDIFDEEPGKVVENFKLSVIYVPKNPLSQVPEESSSGASVPVSGNLYNVLI